MMFVPPWFSPGTPAEALVCTPRTCVLVHDVKSTGSYRPSEPGKSTNNFVSQRYSCVGHLVQICDTVVIVGFVPVAAQTIQIIADLLVESVRTLLECIAHIPMNVS